MTRKEMQEEIRRRTKDFPPELQRMTETMVFYCTYRGIRGEKNSERICSGIVDRGRRVVGFLERHGVLT